MITKEVKSNIYDLLYAIADSYIKSYNPCNIHTDEQGNVECSNSYYDGAKGNELCCFGCKFHSVDGCTVKCLKCKLYLCNNNRCKYKELSSKLQVIEYWAWALYLIPDYFRTKEYALNCSGNDVRTIEFAEWQYGEY